MNSAARVLLGPITVITLVALAACASSPRGEVAHGAPEAAPAAAPAAGSRRAFVPPSLQAPPEAATQAAGVGISVALQERRSWDFDADPLAGVPAVHFDNRFEGARVNECTRMGPHDFRILCTPENEPINPSPWYAFRLRAEADVELRVHLVIPVSKSRPRARTSGDGIHWTRVPDADWKGGEGVPECVLTLHAGPRTTWVASGHVIGAGDIDRWADALSGWAHGSVREIGRSAAGRPLRMFEFAEPGAPEDWVVVIGRQHPPEVPGTVGLMAFMPTVLGPGELAERFRARFRVALVPIVNPDGVVEGQWRSTLGAVDANRDWGPFALPETRAVRDAIQAIAARPGARIHLLLDFHATGRDVFYLPPADARIDPAGFPMAWTDAIQQRFPDYRLSRDQTHNTKEWTFKRWATETFAAPGITYELGGATPHERIRQVVSGAAEEAMGLLLDRVPARVTSSGPRRSPRGSSRRRRSRPRPSRSARPCR